MQQGIEGSGIGVRAGGSFVLERSAGRGHCSFFEASTHRAGRRAPYLRLHQKGSHCLPQPGDSLRLCPTQFSGSHKLLPVVFPYKCLVLAHSSNFPKSSLTSSIWLQQTTYHFLSGARSGTRSIWLPFTAWPRLGTTKPSTSSNHLQITL